MYHPNSAFVLYTVVGGGICTQVHGETDFHCLVNLALKKLRSAHALPNFKVLDL